jgi:NitT/TauT family transport system permease protein
MPTSEPAAWGSDSAVLRRPRRFGAIDLLVLLGVGALVFGIIRLGQQWTGVLRPSVEIDLSPAALPKYTFFSLARGLVAYGLSLAFTLVYGYWAAKDAVAERVLIPMLDILQSIPVLGFMPGLVLALVAAFPRSNVGLELAAVLMIFTGQVWNMTFSFFYSLKAVPLDQREVASIYRFTWWQRLRWVELPFSTIGLVWNSMMSMAGGWFFLMITEAFVLGDKDFRLPGLGSYMSVAVARGNTGAMVAAVVAMALMIVLLDQLLWRPVVSWAQKFRVEEGGQSEVIESWFLEWLQRSGLIATLMEWLTPRPREPRAPKPKAARRVHLPPRTARLLSNTLFAVLLAALLFGLGRLLALLAHLELHAWALILGGAFLTLFRVLIATAVGTAWALPAGLAIGLSPRLSRILQPVVQVVASFPAPMLFPAVIALLAAIGIGLGVGSVVLMLLGTQWYILFNVVAGATAIPADLREASTSFRFGRMQRFWHLYLPAVFPYLVTGWITAAGGAWNASIVSEYVTFRGQVLITHGLGATISAAAAGARFPMLAASIVVMSAMVVTFNRLVWKRMHALAETRFSLNK